MIVFQIRFPNYAIFFIFISKFHRSSQNNQPESVAMQTEKTTIIYHRSTSIIIEHHRSLSSITYQHLSSLFSCKIIFFAPPPIFFLRLMRNKYCASTGRCLRYFSQKNEKKRNKTQKKRKKTEEQHLYRTHGPHCTQTVPCGHGVARALGLNQR